MEFNAISGIMRGDIKEHPERRENLIGLVIRASTKRPILFSRFLLHASPQQIVHLVTLSLLPRNVDASTLML